MMIIRSDLQRCASRLLISLIAGIALPNTLLAEEAEHSKHAQTQEASIPQVGLLTIQPQEAEKILGNVNWAEAREIEVDLDDHSYSPENLRLQKGLPYVLKMKNVGSVPHDLVGGSFFRAIVARMTSSASGRVVTPYVHSIYVRTRNTVELWFVPVTAGTYDFFCSLPGHREDGMEGKIIIE